MKEFIEQVLRTESLPELKLTRKQMRLIHVCFGLQTEAAEFTDQMKKHIFYSKPLDEVNLKEEMGDLLWYIALALDELDSDFGTEAKRVISKIRVRYPDKFTDEKAVTRDLVKEREVLEAVTKLK